MLEAAQMLNPKDFNVFYLRVYLLLEGKHCWFTKNDHASDYKQRASSNLNKSQDLLTNEIAGYESVIINLASQHLENQKIFIQFTTKVEICRECLESINRIKEILKKPLDQDVDIGNKKKIS